MGLAAFKDIIQPRLKTLTPFSPPGEFYRIFAQSLNDWFNVRIPLQYGTITGVVTTPAAGASYPLTGPLIKPQDTSLHLDWSIMKSFELTEEMIYPNIFNYIGMQINLCLKTWISSAPFGIIATIPNIVTVHFMKYGQDFIKRFKSEPLDDPNVYNTFWELFEEYLKKAILVTPPAFGIATGAAPGGMFNGQATIKLLAEPG